jgi:FkbM family methyltransferase
VNTFFDVGANIGYYSILGCKVNPDLKVWAFEPSKGAMYYMGENVEINDLQERIIVEALALSDVCGEIDFYEMRNLKFPKIYNLSGEHNIGTKKEKISYKTTVESITLDDYVNRKSIPDIDLIKLDTEGAENLILRGAGKTLRSHEPVIICETLFNKIEKELESIMRNYDYEFYNHTHDGLKNVKSIVRAKDNGVRNCFFIPRSKVQLVEEWVV